MKQILSGALAIIFFFFIGWGGGGGGDLCRHSIKVELTFSTF